MKKEELIKKAAERGITLTDEQAEKFSVLSDEQLEGFAVSGGRVIKHSSISDEELENIVGGADICGESFSKPVTNERAKNCEYFDSASIFNETRVCRACKSSSRDLETGELFCTNKKAW
ncbi:MAG: hypothetical protein LBM59_07675 [Ruminococcus sp.]|nr:hypothetical protein [Ruminococcus sp.]